MKKSITFREMPHSEVLEKYVNEQLAKVEEFLTHESEPIFLDVVFEAHRTHAHHQCEIRLKTPRFHVICHDEAPDMYAVVDKVVDTLYRELREKKKKFIDDQRHKDSFKGA